VDGNRCVFNTVVDFVFVSGDAQTWNGTSRIVVRDGDLPDDDFSSDHRPAWRGLKSTPNSASLQPLAKLKSDLRLFEMQIT
jgi:hypothetical protein